MHDRSRLRHTISLQPGWEPPLVDRPSWTRRFGRPLDLPRDERLVLVIVPGPDGTGCPREPGRVTLNGEPFAGLPAAASLEAPEEADVLARDVTAILAVRNELLLDCGAPQEAPGAVPRAHRPLPTAVARVWIEVHAGPDGDGHP